MPVPEVCSTAGEKATKEYHLPQMLDAKGVFAGRIGRRRIRDPGGGPAAALHAHLANALKTLIGLDLNLKHRHRGQTV